jgi:hypothetical protein
MEQVANNYHDDGTDDSVCRTYRAGLRDAFAACHAPLPERMKEIVLALDSAEAMPSAAAD